ncbi:MAG: ABC transporter ATP-binding protein [Lachnospiraceae bacterium]|jgi:ATP-binding cassette subfamily B protein|nr:ABC transporter ATP-binding protein [Lachnospiraceae bacterium]
MGKKKDGENRGGQKREEQKKKTHSFRNFKRAAALSFSTKSRMSHVVTVLSVVFAFLPVWLARQFQALTDGLLGVLAVGGGGAAGTGQSGAQAAADATGKLSDGVVWETVWLPFLLVLLLLLLQLFLESAKSYCQKEDARNANRHVTKSLLELQATVRYPYIENHDDFQERVQFAMQFTGGQVTKVLSEISLYLAEFLMLLLVAGSLARVNPWFVVITVLVSIPSAYITYKYQDETFQNEVRGMQDSAMINHYFWILATQEFMQEVRHFRLFSVVKGKWRETADRYIGRKNRIMGKHAGINVVNDIVRNLVCLLVLVWTARMIYENPMLGIGVFTLVLTLTRQLLQFSSDLFSGMANLVSYLPYMGEYFSLMELPREQTLSGQPAAGQQIAGSQQTTAGRQMAGSAMAEQKNGLGEIAFSGVSFSYPDTDREVLHDISVRIKPGEKIAIVGENGSGKTTFINLLCGLYEAGKGEILVNGRDIKTETAKVRDGLTVAVQNFAHYEDTMRENIVISDGSRQIEDGKIRELLKSLDSLEVVESQKEGLSERLGSYSLKGNDLSGGQWQKLAIARAAWRDKSSIMILDEPTAALDPMAETKLYQDFNALTGDRTVLLISHRLGVTSLVDRILVFSDGRIIEDGSHKELMQAGGYYAKMYQAQAEWYQ